MSYGSNEAAEEAEDEYREQIAQEIATNAAELVAARDMTREEAIEVATGHQRHLREADGDITGVIETLDEAQRPVPSCQIHENQVKAIARELIDDARDAARNF